jgi:ceramide glucosyltransferase
LILVALALCGVLYTIAAAMVITTSHPALSSTPDLFPSVTILKPMRGASPLLREYLESAISQDYLGQVQIVFGAHSADDSAVPIVRELIAAHPGRDLQLVIDSATHGTNGKISNLANMLPSAAHDLLVISDSDIHVPPDWLRTIFSELEQTNVGAVTCLYRGKAFSGFWSELSAAGISTQFLPNAIFGSAIGLAHPCTGATIALRRETLDQIGGITKFANELADDFEIGRSIRAKGLAVNVSSVIVEHGCGERSFAEWFAHELRWARTIRMIDPLGYAGSVITQPLPLALLGLLFFRPAGIAVTAVAAALVSRLFLKLATDRRVKERPRSFWLLPVRDILWFAIFIVSFFGSRVRWQEAEFKARRAGRLS